jgi:hypothetical protein
VQQLQAFALPVAGRAGHACHIHRAVAETREKTDLDRIRANRKDDGNISHRGFGSQRRRKIGRKVGQSRVVAFRRMVFGRDISVSKEAFDLQSAVED